MYVLQMALVAIVLQEMAAGLLWIILPQPQTDPDNAGSGLPY